VAIDDDEVRARLERLEAEVAQEAGEARRRADAAARAARPRPVAREEREERATSRHRSAGGGAELGDALALARRAADAKQELTRPRRAGEKSWLISGGLSFALGPLGWLYAGAWREAVPASLFYLLAAAAVGKILPMFLLMPVLMVVLPLSGIAGVVYALGHNRNHRRVRLFGDDEDPRRDRRLGQLGSGDDEEG